MSGMIMAMNDEELKSLCKCLSIFVMIIGAIIMIIFGSICINKEIYDLCGNTIGSRLLLIFGILIIMYCCFGGYVWITKKKTIKNTNSNIYKKMKDIHINFNNASKKE